MTTVNNGVPSMRLAVDRLSPKMMDAMSKFDEAAEESQLDVQLLELVRTRASQINGCAFCLDAHSTEALKAGETERRLFALPAWRESPFFTHRERAALALTEGVTLMATARVTDEVWADAAAEFTEVELSELMWNIVAINVWNRIAGIARPWPIG